MAKIKPDRIGTPRIVQSEARPSVWVWGLLLIALGLWSWQVYEYGRTFVGHDLAARADIEGDLRRQIAELERERDELRFMSARYERASQIDREATQAVHAEIRSLENERADLEQELAMLRERLSGGESKFEIADYSLRKLEPENRYRYAFTVSRMVKSNEKIEGRVIIRVAGELQGKSTELSLADLADDGTEVHKLGFRHFQKVEGELKLPPEFVPNAMIIDVEPKATEFKPFSQTFDWI